MSFIGSTVRGWAVSSTGGIAAYYAALTGVDDAVELVPETFTLAQNYPNPFNPTTTIRYSLPKDAYVSLKVYNLLGQEIATLTEESQSIGTFNVVWNGRNNFGAQVATGMYIYRLEAKPNDGSQPFVMSKRMLLVK
jgi:flagellar hook assembly protein FlgD